MLSVLYTTLIKPYLTNHSVTVALKYGGILLGGMCAIKVGIECSLNVVASLCNHFPCVEKWGFVCGNYDGG